MSPLETGDQLDHYRIDALVARSGMACLFRATDLNTGATVAIKIPHPQVESDPVLFDRFRREGTIGRELNHPSVMKVLPEEKRRRVYMVMEWIEGESLRVIMDREGRLDPDRALRIAIVLCDALDHIHAHGVIHRDLKPENILVSSSPSGVESVKLIDFGIALQQSARRLTYGGFSKLSGTPDYISPERVKGKRGDARSDIYGLGILLFEMLTGELPFHGPTAMAVINSRLNYDPTAVRELNPEISPALERVLNRILQRDPAARYQTASELALDLENPEAAVIPNRIAAVAKPSRSALFYSALAMIPTAILALLLLAANHQ